MKYYARIKRDLIRREALQSNCFHIEDFNKSEKTKIVRESFKDDDTWCKIYENNYIRMVMDEAFGLKSEEENKIIYRRSQNGISNPSTIQITKDEILIY